MIELLLEAERALSMGRADRAEQLYDQVVASDPRNSIAVVGLARVALERADDAGALVLARRALTIDPENDAARRLVQRLEEVLLARGEALPVQAAVPSPPAPWPPLPDEPSEAAMRPSQAAAPATKPPHTGDPRVTRSPTPTPTPTPVPAPAPSKATPFDGPDPVLGRAAAPVGPDASESQPAQAQERLDPSESRPVRATDRPSPRESQPVQPKERRSLLDRIRRR